MPKKKSRRKVTFSPYILFLTLLVPILKMLLVLVFAVTSKMEKIDVANGRNK